MENAAFTESRNSVRILQKRKQKNQDAYEYLIGNYYSSVKDYMIKYLYQCQPNREQTFQSYVPMGQENTISILPVLKSASNFGVCLLRTSRWRKSGDFIRINDPEKIRIWQTVIIRMGCFKRLCAGIGRAKNCFFLSSQKDMDDPTPLGID